MAILLLAVLFLSEARFMIRPGLFTLGFTALSLFVLNKYRSTKILYALPAIQLFWVNMHGYFLVGILLILIYGAAETIKRNFKLPFEWSKKNTLSDIQYKRLSGVVFLVILASFVNPNGWKGLAYPFMTLFSFSGESKIFFKHIFELKPLIVKYRILLPHLVIPWFKIVIAVSALSFLMNFKRLDIGNLALYVTFLIAAVKSNRNIAIFSVTAYTCMILNLNDIYGVSHKFKRFRQQGEFLKNSLSIALVIFMSVLLFHNLTDEYYSFEKGKFKKFCFGISSISRPEKAVDFIKENKIKGNVLNDFNSGAYFIWRLSPEKKVFIDGRTELYGVEFFMRSKKIFQDKKIFKELIKKHDINCILVAYVLHIPIPGNILKSLYEDKDWVLVYLDNLASVFVKNTKENKEIIEKFDVSKRKPDYAFTQTEIEELKRRNVYPYAMIRKAAAMEALGLYGQALKGAEYALRIKPDCIKAYQIAASCYAGMEDYNAALTSLKKALLHAPGNVELRQSIGFIYAKLGDFEKALKEYKEVLRLNPSSITTRYLIGKAYMDLGRYEEAVSEFNEAFEGCKKQKSVRRPFLIELFNNMGIAYFRAGKFEESRKAFLKALELDPEDETAKKYLRE